MRNPIYISADLSKQRLQSSAEIGNDYLTGNGSGLVTCQEQQDVCYISGHAGLYGKVHMLSHLAHHVHIQTLLCILTTIWCIMAGIPCIA